LCKAKFDRINKRLWLTVRAFLFDNRPTLNLLLRHKSQANPGQLTIQKFLGEYKMNIRCPQCGHIQVSSQFCANCGIKFDLSSPAPPKKSNTGVIAIVAIASVIGMCVICGMVGSLTKTKDSQPTAAKTSNSTPIPVQSTTPPPLTLAELKQKTNELLKMEREEYSKEDLQKFDDVMKPLREIPKESKDYKEAQNLNKKLIEKSSVIIAEKVLLGDKPSELELRFAFNDYLSSRLNDYDSSEYVDYSPAVKEYVKKEPFWTSVLRLRAKNAFGAYIVKDVKFYIRNKKAILADGL
jgi:hypothetical protein